MEIARVFLDVSMSLGFQGLEKIMRDSKMNPDAIAPGKFTVFINKAQTSFKLVIGKHHLLYHRNGHRRFPLEAIQEFPQFFDGKKLDFAGAVKKTLEKKFMREGIK